MQTIYLDFNATTPLDPVVREAMLPYLDNFFGNPSSVHHIGRQARALLDEARYRVAEVWHCKPSEVVFTSGGTESNNLALFGSARLRSDRGKHLVTSAIEHHAVLHCFDYLQRKEGFEVTSVLPAACGSVDPQRVIDSIRQDTILVSVMAANNEIGTLNSIGEIGRFCREKGILFHTDAVQWFGKQPFSRIDQFEADLVSCCAHKFHGPKGAGVLFIRSPLLPDPILFGGGHENERRAGTENLAGIVGLVEAMERFIPEPVFNRTQLEPLSMRLWNSLSGLEGVTRVGNPQEGLCNTVSFTVEGCDSMGLMACLDMEGICASSGSACSAGSLEPSHVLTAMGQDAEKASALVRFSLGRTTTEEECARVEGVLASVISRVREGEKL